MRQAIDCITSTVTLPLPVPTMQLSVLENGFESRILSTIQPQEIGYLSKMVDTPESLRLATSVRALEPWQPKRTRLESPVCIGHQERLDVWLAHLHSSSISIFIKLGCSSTYSGENLLRLLLAEDTLKHGGEAFWLSDLRITVNPERAVQGLNDGRKLCGRLERERAQSTLDSQRPWREAFGRPIRHGNGEVLGPVDPFFLDPYVLVCREYR